MIDMVCKILAPAASKKGLPYYPSENMSMGEFFELHEKTMEHIIYPSFEQVGFDDKGGYLSVLRKIRNILDHQKGSKHVNLIRYLLKPCSFGQAVVMMEKGAVMKCLNDSFMRYVGSDFLSLSHYMLFVYKDKWVHDPTVKFNLLYANDWQYAPWFKNGVVDKEIKDFCDDILGVKK